MVWFGSFVLKLVYNDDDDDDFAIDDDEDDDLHNQKIVKMINCLQCSVSPGLGCTRLA